ncbi:MAG TPA: MFS transporter [Bdellovibrionota bacterium]|jgi:MFS family permease|nr:MFS transporter [Bdellovibrionota bacterium]
MTSTSAIRSHSSGARAVLNIAVLVAALGYFVDIYDLILFSIVRVPSLKALGFEGETLFQHGVWLLNTQMAGMLLGGILWGILGDKRGRLSVLFGSIVLYSIANVANGMVQSIGGYTAWRFIAGLGLAGELGAGITLVSEVLPKESRGWGTTIVASVGICGALLASKVAEALDWRYAYFVGGGLGLLLLGLRVAVFESGLFEKAKKKNVKRGDFFHLFRTRRDFFKYLYCILIGVPIWYVVGVLMTFSPEFAQALGAHEPVSAGKAILYNYAGLAVGDLASGMLSQALSSRRKAVGIFLVITSVFVAVYLTKHGLTADSFYWICSVLGFGSGYWAVFVTMGSEQFGTNLRATVTTTVPNFVRGSVVPLTLSFAALKGAVGIVPAGAAVGIVALGIAFFSLFRMEETFHKDLDYFE